MLAQAQSGAPQEPLAGGSLQHILQRQREAYQREGAPSYALRMEHLDKLALLLRENQEPLAAAVSQDFGHHSRHEFLLAEIYTTLNGIRYARKHLAGWMKERRVPVPLEFLPGKALLHPEPLGVVGIVSPWNYPVQLAILPLVGALAAGNRVLLKPSEFTPATSAALARLLGEAFPAERVAVVLGGPEVGQAFCGLPLDHLLFTGSTAVGRRVMRAAAEHLTPVTLELGGKSPAIVGEDAPLLAAAESIVAGKLLNAGQTCIAPDYVLVPAAKRDALVESLLRAVTASYPRLAENPDYTCVLDGRHWARLQGYLEDARSKGATVVPLNPAQEPLPPSARKFPPTLVLDPSDDMAVMQEEIFGPILPIRTYGSLAEAIAYVNAHPRPLALYYFGRDAAQRREVLERTVAGGVTVNDTLFHIAVEALPFGGVGPSGMGAYHGRAGFDTFTHRKPVFIQSRFNGAGMLRPPYGRRVEAMLKFLIGRG